MNRIKECRIKKGMSQKFVALSLGVKPPTVWGWENDKFAPTQENLSALADLFGVSVDYLLGREESSKNTLSVVSQVVEETSSWPSKSNSEQNLERHPNLLPDLVRKRANAHAKIDLLYNSEVQELNNFIDFLFSKRQEEEQP